MIYCTSKIKLNLTITKGFDLDKQILMRQLKDDLWEIEWNLTVIKNDFLESNITSEGFKEKNSYHLGQKRFVEKLINRLGGEI